MKVTSLAVQLLPGESGDCRLATHRELVIAASAAPARSRRKPNRAAVRRGWRKEDAFRGAFMLRLSAATAKRIRGVFLGPLQDNTPETRKLWFSLASGLPPAPGHQCPGYDGT